MAAATPQQGQALFGATLLSGKTALLLGSTSGIALRAAEGMAGAGAARVILNGRDPQAGARERARLQALYPDTEVLFLPGSYLDSVALDGIFTEVEDLAGGLDILVHTCGTGAADNASGPKPFVDTDPAYWLQATQGIFLSLLHSCRRAIPLMQRRGGGAIVDITSDAARLATPGEAVLGGLLAANNMFLKGIALEHGRDRIRANVVTPSITTDTRNYDIVMSGGFSKKLFEKAERRARLGVASATDVANTVVFLASPLASHMTGQVISVNGGISVA